MKKAELKTIKVLPSTVINLNKIAEKTNESQYEVVERLAKTEKEKLIKSRSK
jgi:DNA-binding Lrp family transcriptional regulator